MMDAAKKEVEKELRAARRECREVEELVSSWETLERRNRFQCAGGTYPLLNMARK
jgi:hypothetical protein